MAAATAVRPLRFVQAQNGTGMAHRIGAAPPYTARLGERCVGMRNRWWLGGIAGLFAAATAAALDAPVPAPAATPAGDLHWQAFRGFTSADGLPQNGILALAQDGTGFVYAGTYDGLARYDGRQWQEITLPGKNRRYAVGALASASDGSLWIGTDAAGTWRLDDGELEAIALPADAGPVNALLADGGPSMWVAAQQGLFRCVPSRCTRIEAIGNRGARSVFAETRDGSARLWVGTNDEGFVELIDPQSSTPRRSGLKIDRANGLPNNVGLAMARFGGDLWLGSGRGLARFDGTRLHVYDERNGFPPAMVFAFTEDRDARGEPRLLVALRPGGIASIGVDGRWQLLDSRQGLPANAVHSLLRERHRGTLWIGTIDGGIARVERERWAVFDERLGLPDRITTGVGMLAGDVPWVGTSGGAAAWRDGRFRPLLPASSASIIVHDLADTPDGRRWIAHAQGLQRWNGDRLEEDFRATNSALPGVSASAIAVRRSAGGIEVYALTGHGLGRWRATDGLVRVDGIPGFDARETMRGAAVIADASRSGSDVLWLAGPAAVARLDDTGWRRVDAACLVDGSINGLAVRADDSGETAWLAMRDGLWRLGADGNCEVYPATRALGTLDHVRLAGDALFVFGARGALRLAVDGRLDQDGTAYGPSAGLPNPEIAASAVDSRGRLFAATSAGLAALARPPPAGVREPAPLRLLAAFHGASAAPLTDGARLASADSTVHFEYALLAFDREYATRYRHRLDGLDGGFGAWSDATAVTYPRLPAGRYRFVVEARDADRVAAAPVELHFEVEAEWWQRPWALATAALLLVVAGVGAGRWRLRATRRRAFALEREVALRTRELAAANTRLEQAALTDPLTGLPNRRRFGLAAPREAERARNGPAARALLVVLLDLDHFKRINDSFGHAGGDTVLTSVAQRLRASLREGDLVLRWGGEEFLLLLRDVERSAIEARVEALLDAIAAEPVDIAGQALSVTASAGAIAWPPADDVHRTATLEQAITLADAALYQAKRAGRDCAVLAAHASEPIRRSRTSID